MASSTERRPPAGRLAARVLAGPALAVLVGTAVPEVVRAQPHRMASALAAAPVGRTVAAPDPADDSRWRLDRCLLGMGYHSVGRLSLGAAGGLRRGDEERSVCLFGAAHAGLGAARSALGSAVTLGRFGSAIGVSGGALRTFDRPGSDAEPWRTYVGGSVHVWPLLGVHTELGRYRRVPRAGEATSWLTTWGVGFGY